MRLIDLRPRHVEASAIDVSLDLPMFMCKYVQYGGEREAALVSGGYGYIYWDTPFYFLFFEWRQAQFFIELEK